MVGLELNKKTYLLVTGASRGIGQTFAIKVASKLKPDSLVVLLARNESGLAKTKEIILNECNGLKVETFCVELAESSATTFKDILQLSLDKNNEKSNNFDCAFIIHNAGTVGDVTKRADEVSNLDIWHDYYQVNLFSTIALNCEFCNLFAKVSKIVVNLSSLCAIEPFPSMTYYCTAKAARDMYFRMLAVELETNAHVLNYAPGAIDTDMTVTVQETTTNSTLAATFKQQRENKTMLTTEQTANRFLQILQLKDFQSGAHIDYYDI